MIYPFVSLQKNRTEPIEFNGRDQGRDGPRQGPGAQRLLHRQHLGLGLPTSRDGPSQ